MNRPGVIYSAPFVEGSLALSVSSHPSHLKGRVSFPNAKVLVELRGRAPHYVGGVGEDFADCSVETVHTHVGWFVGIDE